MNERFNVNVFYAVGRFFSPVYGFAMSLREALYQRGVLTRHRLPVPVVSVGNLTLGGTGKTPMTLYLARLLADRRPVVVSRGYGGKAKERVNVVSDGSSRLLDAAAAGDEPALLARSLTGVPVITSKKRAEGGRLGVERFGAGTVILDDGFQHLALDRDLNLVLFKVDTFLGNNRVFPGGDMREPLKALGRAHAFVLTCVDDDNRKRALAIRDALEKRFPGIPVFLTEYRAVSLAGADGEALSLTEVRELPLYAFCGLANPHAFSRTLEQTGLNITGLHAYQDHCRYPASVRKKLLIMARESGARGLVTTEKDLVKLRGRDFDLPLYALQMELVPEEGFDSFVLEKMEEGTK